MALVAIADVRRRWGFDKQTGLEVGTIFLNAQDLRVSTATRTFYPTGDIGRPLARPHDVEWIPEQARFLAAGNIDATKIAAEFAAELAVQLD